MSLRTILSVFFVSSAVLALPAPRDVNRRGMPIETVEEPYAIGAEYTGTGKVSQRSMPIEIDDPSVLDPVDYASISASGNVQQRRDIDFKNEADFENHLAEHQPALNSYGGILGYSPNLQRRQDVDFNDNTDVNHVIIHRPGFGPKKRHDVSIDDFDSIPATDSYLGLANYPPRQEKRQDVSIDGIDSVPYFNDFVNYNPVPIDSVSVTKRQDNGDASTTYYASEPDLSSYPDLEPLIFASDDGPSSPGSGATKRHVSDKSLITGGGPIIDPNYSFHGGVPSNNKRDDAKLHLGPGPVIVDPDELDQDSLPTMTKRGDVSGSPVQLGSGPVVVNDPELLTTTHRVARPTPMQAKRGVERRQDASSAVTTTPAAATPTATLSVPVNSTDSSDGDSYDYGYDADYGYDGEYDDQEYDEQEYYMPVAVAEVVPQDAGNSTETR